MTWDGVDRRQTKFKVLHVDDNPAELELYHIGCERMNVEHFGTTSPTTFIQHYELGKYNACLIDFKMDFVDGVTLIRMLKHDRAKNTKVYILSGYDREYITKLVNGDKFHGLLSKNDGPDAVIQQVLEDANVTN